jgi:hypothetical protein
MKHAFAFLLLLAAVSCHAPEPTLDMPRPYQRSGVRVILKELYKMGDNVAGVTGEAENVSGATIKSCTLNFVVLDFHDLKVSDARATRENIEPGEHWTFQALFTTPFTSEFDRVVSDQVVVKK